MITKSRRRLLLNALINSIPIMVKRGKERYVAIFDIFKSVGIAICEAEFLKQLKILSKIIKILIAMNKGSVDRGRDINPNEPKLFTTSPINIRKEMLNPTENKRVSTVLDVSSPNTRIRRKPIINVR
jgi:hypothetical protein